MTQSLSFFRFRAAAPSLFLSFGFALSLMSCSTVTEESSDSSRLVPILVTTSEQSSSEQSEPNSKFGAAKSGYANVNGLKMYYEIYEPRGENLGGKPDGVPLVLLHGGGSSIDVTYSKVLPYFAKNHRVIAIDEQAHGRSGDRKGPVRFETSADDVAALLKSLQIEKADVMGFSNGASVALQVAIRHPAVVRKLVFVSAFTKKSGAPKGFWDFMKKADFSSMPQPLKDAYLKINNDPAGLKNMHDKDSERMRSFKDVPDRDLKALRAETLIVLGDRDVVTPAHAVYLNKEIKGSRLLILPGGHGDFLGELTQTHGESRMPALTAGLITEFLKTK